MRTRNPEACCGNCPYWDDDTDGPVLYWHYCRKSCPPHKGATQAEDFCGEHPEFWMEEKAILTKYELCAACGKWAVFRSMYDGWWSCTLCEAPVGP